MASLVSSSRQSPMRIDDKIIELLGKSIDVVGQKFKALVIYNEGSNFSLGANLGLALFAANIAAWGEIEKSIATGQKTYKALKYAPFPVGRGSGGHGARWRLRDRAARRRGAGACRNLYRPR